MYGNFQRALDYSGIAAPLDDLPLQVAKRWSSATAPTRRSSASTLRPAAPTEKTNRTRSSARGPNDHTDARICTIWYMLWYRVRGIEYGIWHIVHGVFLVKVWRAQKRSALLLLGRYHIVWKGLLSVVLGVLQSTRASQSVLTLPCPAAASCEQRRVLRRHSRADGPHGGVARHLPHLPREREELSRSAASR